MGLIADLPGGSVGVDTMVFIYLIEEHPTFLPIVSPLFRRADDGGERLVTSALTLLEVLVLPYSAGNRPLADRYEALLTRSRGIELVSLTHRQLRAAAQLRSATGVKTPDALQLVAAIGAGCGAFVTNDRRLPSFPGLPVIQLSSYAGRGAP
ncbi:MAG: PIN domain-containing protein [Acidobacteria bacterium]|nr:PIN domain-containing protein [Acidobacteriota bacterium]